MWTAKGVGSAALKAGLREPEEGAGAVRQALSLGRQAVLLVARHLAEGEREPVGQEHRVIAEALVAARRIDQRAVDRGLEFLDMAVRPGDAQRRDEMRLAALRRGGAALAQQRVDPRHGAGEILGGAGPARRMDAGLAA